MLDILATQIKQYANNTTAKKILFYGFIIRFIALTYSVAHDHYVDHIKYTDVDYHVFTNASRAIINMESPYQDVEYRYSPLIALLFTPNILLNVNVGKLCLITADILSGHLLYLLNIQQGTHRLNSKLYLIIWLYNPVTIAISTRGSFEPILTLIVLASISSLMEDNFLLSGLLYGLSVHLKLYPIIYALSIYIFIIRRKPYLRTQTKISYWIKTLSPGINHFKFLLSSCASLGLSSLISYRYYGQDYLNQSILYHLRRKDLQHNFSVCFYLFRLFPKYQEQLSFATFMFQLIGVLVISTTYSSFETNRRTRLRKLSFSLFGSTLLFVSLNKVCTSQYFNWYLIFVPLILDSVKLESSQLYALLATWTIPQANWLLFAYLYEYRNLDVFHHLGLSSILFLLCNLWILSLLCRNFNATTKRLLNGEEKSP